MIIGKLVPTIELSIVLCLKEIYGMDKLLVGQSLPFCFFLII